MPTTLAAAAAGEGDATAAGEAAGLATGLPAAAADGAATGLAAGAVAGETEPTGWMTGEAAPAGAGVGAPVGGLVTVIGWGGLWHATSSVVAASATPSAQRVKTVRRVNLIAELGLPV